MLNKFDTQTRLTFSNYCVNCRVAAVDFPKVSEILHTALGSHIYENQHYLDRTYVKKNSVGFNQRRKTSFLQFLMTFNYIANNISIGI
jgi:hypothetical protein